MQTRTCGRCRELLQSIGLGRKNKVGLVQAINLVGPDRDLYLAHLSQPNTRLQGHEA